MDKNPPGRIGTPRFILLATTAFAIGIGTGVLLARLLGLDS